MATASHRSAFTLIEIAIVLVIIGLVISGLFVGKTLIRAASLRRSISEIDTITAAADSFKVKYNCLPGDCKTAASFFADPVVVNGDGNRFISAFPDGDHTEVWQFWVHLADAQMIQGKYSGVPGPYGMWNRAATPGVNVMASSYGNNTGYTVINWNEFTNGDDWTNQSGTKFRDNTIMFGTSDYNSSLETYAPALIPADAMSIDTKIDDGLPGQGLVITSFPREFLNCSTTADPSTAQYDLTYKGPSCGLLIHHHIMR